MASGGDTARRWTGWPVVAATLLACGVVAIVFLIRAGAGGAANWPISWELRSSDNGVLFQLLQDVVAGRQLDWSFSPQVYVFPELPLSAVAFLLAGGNVYGYYLAVAVLNGMALFLGGYGILRLLHRQETVPSVLARAGVVWLPLAILPLVGTSWLLSYHLAPTYYFGMYLLLFAAPMLFLVRTAWRRWALAAALALTIASNPLALVFAFPAFACVLLVLAAREGLRATGRPAGLALVVLVAAAVIRLVLLSPLQGTSPLSYIDPEVFAGRVSAIGRYLDVLSADPVNRALLVIGALLAVVCAAGGVLAIVLWARRRPPGARLLVLAWFGLVPLTGLAGTVILLITHYLYLWPVLVAPFCFVLLALPRGWAGRMLPAGLAVLVAVALLTGALSGLAHPERYFGFRNAETHCLDDHVPGAVGYSTFSDARRLSLTSRTGFRLVQVTSGGTPSFWLTNRSYALTEPGTFFYLNGYGDEPAIDEDFLTESFGEPDEVVACSDAQRILVYRDSGKLERIRQFYTGAGE